MKKIIAFITAVVLTLSLLCGCSAPVGVDDGIYRVEFSDYDSNGYKDFVEFTVENGEVKSMVADAVDKDGNLKTDSAEYRSSMESITGTYPEKYYTDLVNEYIGVGSSDKVDVIAGATLSSDNFIILMRAVEKAIKTKNVTNRIVVDRK